MFFLLCTLFLTGGGDAAEPLIPLQAPRLLLSLYCCSTQLAAGVYSRPASSVLNLHSSQNACCPFYFTGGGEGGGNEWRFRERTRNSSQLKWASCGSAPTPLHLVPNFRLAICLPETL